MLPRVHGALRLAVRTSPRHLQTPRRRPEAVLLPARCLSASARALSSSAEAPGMAREEQRAEQVSGEGSASAPVVHEKNKKKPKAPTPPKAPALPIRPLPSFIDLRVGKIVDIERHPNADTLYVEKVDFGEHELRTVLSGLVHNVPIEALKDRMIVGVCNLKPVSMRGIKSHGMLLCAVHKDGDAAGVEPVRPPAGSQPGDRLWVEGYEDLQPEGQLNPKKKIFEAIQPHYLTTEDKVCAWRGIGPKEDPATAEPRIRLIRGEKGPLLAHFEGAALA